MINDKNAVNLLGRMREIYERISALSSEFKGIAQGLSKRKTTTTEIIMTETKDRKEADRRKKVGMDQAAANRSSALATAQSIARSLAAGGREITSDDVAEEMNRRGMTYEDLGNAAGSIFRQRGFTWTGKTMASARPSSHGRIIRVWSLES